MLWERQNIKSQADRLYLACQRRRACWPVLCSRRELLSCRRAYPPRGPNWDHCVRWVLSWLTFEALPSTLPLVSVDVSVDS